MATLVYSDVDGVDRSFALGSEPVMVGRGHECAIRSQDPRVSRLHARFFVDQGTLWVEDLGSSNGIFVGPNKVQRAPVPTGEIILVGSLMIRLLPASGTLPPPMGLHGTLATWLDLERKTRVAVEEERDAFAKRVGELHQDLAAARAGGDTLRPTNTVTATFDPEAIRLRDEAEARAAMLESTLAAVQSELDALREVHRGGRPLTGAEPRGGELTELKNALDEAQSARSIAEHAHGEASRESQMLREQLEELQRRSAAEIEIANLTAAKAREAKMMAEAAVGIATAEKLAEADLVISRLEGELAALKAAQAGPDAKSQQATQQAADQLTTITAKAEKLEKELAAAQIRAQGAERNLSGANAQAAKAESRAAQLEQKLVDADTRIKAAEQDVAKAMERVAQLESRVGAGDAPLQASEARAAKLAAELVEMTGQYETRRDRLIELETSLAAQGDATKAAEARVAASALEIEQLTLKLTAAEKRAGELQARIDSLASADAAIASATKARDELAAKVQLADKRVTDAERRASDAEVRASAADTMAKAMAKDVAEALRRAADADQKAKGVHRDLAEAIRRAEQAEARINEGSSSVKVIEDRAAAAEARVVELQHELAAKLEATHKELTAKLEATQQDLTGKLEATQRELAAERSGLLALVDRKTQLERELAEARALVPAIKLRADEAEGKVAENEVLIETLHERITDLESGMAVTETASQAAIDETRERSRAIEAKHKELTAAAAKSSAEVERLRERVGELEGQLREASTARSTAETALQAARLEISALLRASDARAAVSEDDEEKLRDALARASDAERKLEGMVARADAAELAIGRAGALQRQLDESLSKLAWLEREASTAKGREAKAVEQSEAVISERVRSAEIRVKEAETRAEQRVAEAEERVQDAQARVAEASDQIAAMKEQLVAAQQRIAQAEEAARAAAAAAATADAQADGRGAAALEQRLADAQGKLAALQKEVDAAENVRSFAAETEREIAQLQRELRDTKSKLTQMTLERDRLASELKDARGDDDTTNRSIAVPRVAAGAAGARPPQYDPEVTAQADVSRYEAMIAKSTELEKKLAKLEREDAALRTQLADAEDRLRAAIDGPDDDDDAEATRTGSQLPIALAEHVSVLEEAIDSLRANMRAASDETAMMDQSSSVTAISDAVSSAAEHIERARAAIKALAAAIGMS